MLSEAASTRDCGQACVLLHCGDQHQKACDVWGRRRKKEADTFEKEKDSKRE